MDAGSLCPLANVSTRTARPSPSIVVSMRRLLIVLTCLRLA
jgi:hypothetical protein